jgi:heat-inducible transcriptional repressor
MLSLRDREILHSIVESYIETGEPVASRTVSRARHRDLSPATIRNVMADLYEEGYLSQPHTSAGRIPTAKAFREYVQTLAGRKMIGPELHRLRMDLRKFHTVEDRVERSSHILSEMTSNMAIAAAIPTSTQTLTQIELLVLGDRRVLMVVVTSDRMVRNKVVMLDEDVTQDQLNSIRNYINMEFSGWVLEDIHRELHNRLAMESAAYDDILKRLALLYQKGLLEVVQTPAVHLDGASNLVSVDLHLTQENLRQLFRALEEKKKILMLLDRFLETPAGEIAVQVGLAEAHPSMSELAIIGVTIQLPDGLSAKIAVLGPMRMDYSKVISSVLHLGHAFQTLAS